MKFLDIEIDEKLFKKLIIVAIIFIIVYMAFTMSSLLIFKSYTLGANTEVVEERVLNTHIDILEPEGKKVEIAGWAYKEGEPLGTVNSNYVLRHKETGKMYLMRTKMVENANIQDENYKLAGMHAQCLLLGAPSGWYDILVLYQNAENDILTPTLIEVEIK